MAAGTSLRGQGRDYIRDHGLHSPSEALSALLRSPLRGSKAGGEAVTVDGRPHVMTTRSSSQVGDLAPAPRATYTRRAVSVARPWQDQEGGEVAGGNRHAAGDRDVCMQHGGQDESRDSSARLRGRILAVARSIKHRGYRKEESGGRAESIHGHAHTRRHFASAHGQDAEWDGLSLHPSAPAFHKESVELKTGLSKTGQEERARELNARESELENGTDDTYGKLHVGLL